MTVNKYGEALVGVMVEGCLVVPDGEDVGDGRGKEGMTIPKD